MLFKSEFSHFHAESALNRSHLPNLLNRPPDATKIAGKLALTSK